MNPLLNDYQYHYTEAHKSANEVIKQLKIFGEHYSQLYDNDKRKLFEQIIAERGLPELYIRLWSLICFGSIDK